MVESAPLNFTTVKLQWLEHLWNHKNIFETGQFELMSFNHSARSGGHYMDLIWFPFLLLFSVFFNIKVCCVFSLESPHRGDSNEYTQYSIFDI